MDLQTLESALVKAWNEETSYDPKNWAPENPAWGQCAVTALVVQDYFGGKLLQVEVLNSREVSSHYYNELQDGREVDLTKRQFSSRTIFRKPEYCDRRSIFSFTETVRRYEILRSRIKLALKDLL